MSRTIGEPPNVENTVPLRLFQAQSPARYSYLDGDKAVLYAGAFNTRVNVSGHGHDPGQDAVFKAISENPVTVYVLNTSLVLWVPSLHTGVDISYTSIVLHAMKDQDGQEVLYLQVMARGSGASETGSLSQTTELVVGLGSSCPEPVPGLLSKSATVHELYDALSTCSAFHYDSDSDTSESGGYGGDSNCQWFTADTLPSEPMAVPASWLNSGDADDLGMDMQEDPDSEDEAGMNVALNHQPVAGVSRKSNTFDEKDKKRRIE